MLALIVLLGLPLSISGAKQLHVKDVYSLGPLLAGHGDRISIPCFSPRKHDYQGIYVQFCNEFKVYSIYIYNETVFHDTLASKLLNYTLNYRRGLTEISFTFTEDLVGWYTCYHADDIDCYLTTHYTLIDRITTRHRTHGKKHLGLSRRPDDSTAWTVYPEKVRRRLCLYDHGLQDVFYVHTPMSTVSCKKPSVNRCRIHSKLSKLRKRPSTTLIPLRANTTQNAQEYVWQMMYEDTLRILANAELALWLAILTFLGGIMILLKSLYTSQSLLRSPYKPLPSLN
ncbi:membrane protein UL14 [Saimiriine betaherpesvirus 4]|uniref:Membrane protein UL14 n=1 Tax=Saimiriine betaherpesvirus 4 TaxID=1535247 RepID=G8XSS6_9BETA|nr:membrane protein UL14 [Saimiriine betaherpesvirus 4]AEV80873.1 membrane protein UL14 [Saimiriine betaherpesvirus 4]